MFALIFTDKAMASANSHTEPVGFQTPDGDIPQKIPEEPPKNIFKKPRSKALKKAREIRMAAQKKAAQASSSSSFQGIQDQIRLLNEKIDRLEATREAAVTPSCALSDENTPNRSGFIPVPGTNTAIKLGGYVKVDGIYDANQFTGDSSNLPNLRLKGLDADAMRSMFLQPMRNKHAFPSKAKPIQRTENFLRILKGTSLEAQPKGQQGALIAPTLRVLILITFASVMPTGVIAFITPIELISGKCGRYSMINDPPEQRLNLMVPKPRLKSGGLKFDTPILMMPGSLQLL